MLFWLKLLPSEFLVWEKAAKRQRCDFLVPQVQKIVIQCSVPHWETENTPIELLNTYHILSRACLKQKNKNSFEDLQRFQWPRLMFATSSCLTEWSSFLPASTWNAALAVSRSETHWKRKGSDLEGSNQQSLAVSLRNHWKTYHTVRGTRPPWTFIVRQAYTTYLQGMVQAWLVQRKGT